MLRSQLILLVGVALLPVLLFAAALTQRLHRQERAAVEQGLRETARAVAVALDRELLGTVGTLRALAASPHLEAGDVAGFEAEARRLATSQVGWRAVG